jgi:hypothetical protein
MPAVHTSVQVDGSMSLQEIPSAAVGLEHTPLWESQTPAMWHWSLAVQTVAIPGAHAPA